MLTARQRNILQLCAEGFDQKEIARLLGLSTGAVKNRLTTIHKTLHAKNTAHAAAIAYARKEIR